MSEGVKNTSYEPLKNPSPSGERGREIFRHAARLTARRRRKKAGWSFPNSGSVATPTIR